MTEDAVAFAATISTEADELVALGRARSVVLRLTGSLAVRTHCPGLGSLLDRLGRRPFRDLDLFGYSKDKREIARLFEGRGYVLDPAIRQAQEFGIKRFVYEHPTTHVKADVFMDELVMAHTVPFVGRLELDDPTITVTDLVLTKLQIHEVTENDLMDTVVLLGEHELDGAGRETVDTGYITDLLRKDWGFYYSAQANLDKLLQAVDRYPALPAEVAGTVRDRVTALHDAIERAPKTNRWKMRARVGTRVRWYEQVEEVNR